MRLLHARCDRLGCCLARLLGRELFTRGLATVYGASDASLSSSTSYIPSRFASGLLGAGHGRFLRVLRRGEVVGGDKVVRRGESQIRVG